MRKLNKRNFLNKKSLLNFNLKKTVFFLVIAGFMLTTIFLTVGTATSSAELVKLQEEESKLVEMRRELSEKIVGQSSLKSIEEESGRLGFAKPKEVIYITKRDFVANLP